MSEAPLTSGGDDDLPRTVRQQKEARARDQMAREILNAPRPAYGQAASKALLREGFGAARVVGAVLVAGGITALRL